MENILFLTIQFITILAFGMFWYKTLRWSPEESVCMAILTAMSLILIAGFLGKAQIAILLIYVLAIVGMGALLLGKRKVVEGRVTGRLVDFFTPGIVVLILVYLYGIIAFQGLVINNWDEMHQWAKAVRYMINFNELPQGENFDGAEILLSSTTIFHYYFCKLASTMTGTIVESNMYVSNLVLWFAAAMLPMSDTNWKNWKAVLAYGVTIFLSMNILFVQPYFNIYCDQPVAIWAGSLIAWIIFGEQKKYRQLFIVLALIHIAFMKNMMGPLFAVIAVLALFIKYVMGFESSIKGTITGLLNDLTVGKIIYGISCVVAVFILTVIWSLKINQNALIRVEDVAETGENRLRLTLESGLGKWFEPVNLSTAVPNITFFLFFVFTILVSIWFAKEYLTKRERKQYQVLMGFYVVGFFAFFVLMMYTYLTTFPYADSIITGSLNRYFSGYMMLGLIPLIVPAFRNKVSAGAAVLLVFFSLSTTNGFFNKAVGIKVKETSNYKKIVEMQGNKETILELMDNPQKIYMINQSDNGLLTVAADYVFEDLIKRNGMCYYFTKEQQNIPGLSYTNIRKLPEILLNDYGYLWIYKTDDYFDSNAFNVLKIRTPKNGDFYKVINSDGILKLNYLGNVTEIMENEEEE